MAKITCFSKEEPHRRPGCGSEKVASILWGHPADEGVRKVEEGKIVLGGCCISDRDPSWQCLKCKRQIYPEERRELSGEDSTAF
jgi:hypothetical protein